MMYGIFELPRHLLHDEKSGRAKKLTNKTKRRLMREVSKTLNTTIVLMGALQLPVSVRIVQELDHDAPKYALQDESGVPSSLGLTQKNSTGLGD